MKTYKAITLVGMMGAGKTCIAKKLAKKLSTYHIDTDQEVKSKTGLSIKEMLEENKENELKTAEFEIIKEHSKNKCVISTGDYTVNNQKAWDYILFHTLTIWINLHLNQILMRLRPNENRPFYSENLDLSNLQELYKERKKRYKQAKIQVKSLNSHKTNELVKIINYYTSETIIL